MKKLSILIFTIIFINCVTLPFEKNPPFTITNVAYKEPIKEITIDYISESSVDFLNVFFRNKKLDIKEIKKQSLYIKFNQFQNLDFQLHNNSKKEFGNKPEKKDLPFKLKKNEVVISYKENNIIKYFKIK